MTVATPQAGLFQMERYRKLYETRQCSASHGIVHVELRKTFDIVLDNFGDKPITLMKGQRVASTISYPLAITESPVSHAGMFGIEKR